MTVWIATETISVIVGNHSSHSFDEFVCVSETLKECEDKIIRDNSQVKLKRYQISDSRVQLRGLSREFNIREHTI